MNEKYLNYNLVKNTIPNKSRSYESNELGIGSKITNLLVDLSQENVFNQYYSEYYGEKSPADGWCCLAVTGDNEETVTKETTLNSADGTIKENKTTTSKEVTIKVGQCTTIRSLNDLHGGSCNLTATGKGVITYEARSDNMLLNLDYEPAITPTSDKAIIAVEAPYDSITWIFYETTTVETTTTTYETSFIISLWSLGLGIPENVEIVSVTTTGDSTKVKNIDWKNQILYATFLGNDASYIITTTVKYREVGDVESIEKGTLMHAVKLKPDKTYVLQVINALQPSDVTTIENSISIDSSWSLKFNQYLFFSTSGITEETEFLLKIGGIGFAYQILGKNDEGIFELRSIKSNQKSKVFLFESDYPWVVDKQGVVVGFHDAPLKTIQKSSKEPLTPLFTQKDIEKIFSQTPVLKCGYEDSIPVLKIELPDLDGLSKWKHYPVWAATESSSNCPPIISKLRLLVYRDHLTEVRRRYNYENIFERRGVARILSKNNKSDNDPYFKDVDGSGKYSSGDKIILRVKAIPVDITENDTSVNLYADKNTTETVSQYDKKNLNTWYPFTLAIGSLFGYNKQYCLDNDIMGTETSKTYKYTSFCFAWGWADDESVVKLSDFSEPILIDRNLVTVSKDSSEDTILTLTIQDCEISKSTVDGYYKSEIIHLDKKA